MVKGITLQEMDSTAASLIKMGLSGIADNVGNAYSLTIPGEVTELIPFLSIRIKAKAASIGAPTFNFNSTGAHPVLKPGGGEASFKKDGIYTLVWDGSTNFILQGEGGEYGTATTGDVRFGKTIGTDSGLVNGTLATRDSGGAITVTPGTNAQMLNAGIYDNNITIEAAPSGIVSINYTKTALSASGSLYDLTETIATLPAGLKTGFIFDGINTWGGTVAGNQNTIIALPYQGVNQINYTNYYTSITSTTLYIPSYMYLTSGGYYQATIALCLRDSAGVITPIFSSSGSFATNTRLASLEFNVNTRKITSVGYVTTPSWFRQEIDLPSTFDVTGAITLIANYWSPSASTSNNTFNAKIQGNLLYG